MPFRSHAEHPDLHRGHRAAGRSRQAAARRSTGIAGAAVIAAAAAATLLGGCDRIDGTSTGRVAATHAGAEPETIRFDVEGMHCTGCVAAIEATARSIDGVVAVRVFLDEGRAEFDLADPALADSVADRIARMGYVLRRAGADADDTGEAGTAQPGEPMAPTQR
ncbi:MAG TPA: heavy metal-associated domain-containing protein [Phycisphaerales bacterium]|nr:heavy metal-associated domain-containing protein [Phycisphaerales bacterium]HMP36467.1 heavy metal-associated domain-containing protein [Phycisphaerales bacterium]